MHKLVSGNPAPLFSATASDGQEIDLASFRHHPILLSFFRYRECPVCSLQYWYLAQRSAIWEAQGLQVISVFESSQVEVQTYASRIAFTQTDELPPVIADPSQKLYHLYGLQTSWFGFLWGFIRRRADYAASRQQQLSTSIISRRYELAAALRKGTLNRMPAQFLLTPELMIATAHYGRDMGDFLPFAEIEHFIERYGTVPTA